MNREPRIVIRKVTNKKHISVEKRLPLVKNFHQFLHDVRNDTEYPQQSEIFGRFKPENIGHFDEIPAPFVFGNRETYEFEGTKRIHVGKPGNALDKRQYTVSLFFNGGEVQYTKPQIIYRGTGKRIPKSETKQYQKGIEHIFQPNAWQDIDTFIALMKHYRLSKRKHGVQEKTMLVMDNLDCHESDRSKQYAGKYANTFLVFTPPNCTDVVSVVDQLAAVWKKLLEHQYERWADINFERWQDNKVTASERRILFSLWVAESWKIMENKTDLINRMFQKTGIILKKDGSDKGLVKVDGIDDYKVPF